MNVEVDDDIFKNRVIDYINKNFISIIEDSFKKKDWNCPEGFGREKLVKYLKEYILSNEFKAIVDNFINKNISTIINEIIVTEIKKQSRDTIKLLINKAISEIDINKENF